MASSITERYLRLGLRLDRHVEGTVDAYFGPPEPAAEIRAEPPVDARELVADAEALLADVEDGWLRDQVVGLRTYAGVLAGESWSYADEVEACYGVRPTQTDEAVFAAAHDELEELLPGEGSLAGRYEAWRTSIRVPVEEVERTAVAVTAEARSQTGRIVELPDGEDVALEVVRDEPWLAFNYYLGDLRSRIAVNVALPISAIDLLHLAIHEAYPGHHTERCCKEAVLVRGRGLAEETIVLVPTPQSLVAEGIAELGARLLLEGDGGPALAGVVRDAVADFDLAHALAVERARQPLRGAEVNGALMLYDGDAAEDEVKAYLRRWALLSPELAAHVVRFITEPTSRSYVMTYSAGLDLCRAYVGDDRARFRRLLTEQVRVRDLVAARAGTDA